jgi:hypothetical protein
MSVFAEALDSFHDVIDDSRISQMLSLVMLSRQYIVNARFHTDHPGNAHSPVQNN